jgi:hypothetical protein
MMDTSYQCQPWLVFFNTTIYSLPLILVFVKMVWVYSARGSKLIFMAEPSYL